MQADDIKTEEGTLAGMPTEILKKSPIMQAISRHAEKWEPKATALVKKFIPDEHIPVGLENPFW